MMNENDIQAIKRFLSNESDYAEAERISAYLLQHPGLMDEYIVFDQNEQLPVISYEERMLILNKIINPQRTVIAVIKKLAVAAAVTGLLVLGLVWALQLRKPAPAVADFAVTEKFLKIRNNTPAQMNIVLPDSSTAQLEPFAEILYDSAFQCNRTIFLMGGNAFFEVRKNPDAPFSVYAKGIKTTALGTAFQVENPVSASLVTVRLKQGKVVLTSTERGFKMNDVFLTPGQACYIDKSTGQVKVVNDKSNTIAVSKSKISAGNGKEDKGVLWTNEGVHFTQAELKNVLHQLEARYNVTIVADERVTKNVVLTGNLYTTDSLRPILKSICDLNKLNYEIRKDSVFLKRRVAE